MNIRVLTHSSIRIEGNITIYCDPFKIIEETHDADIILISHDHFDHFSKEDIVKVLNDDTIILCPKSTEKELLQISDNVISLNPGQDIIIDDVEIETVRAFNIGKPFHPIENNWLGYIVTIEGKRIYIAGDTDLNEDNKNVACDIALLPIGGKYTMDGRQAAEFANILKPEIVIPTHFGSVVENDECLNDFVKNVDKNITISNIIERL